MTATAFDTYIANALEKGDRKLARRLREEKRMASALVKAVIARGFSVSIDNREAVEIKKSRSHRDVMAVMFLTDEEYVLLHDADGQRAGWFFLVYGNSGPELINDHADNEACRTIWGYLQPLADRIEEGR